MHFGCHILLKEEITLNKPAVQLKNDDHPHALWLNVHDRWGYLHRVNKILSRVY